MTKTNVHRDINRPYFSFDQIEDALEKRVVKDLIRLIKFRNSHPSFDGKFSVSTPESNQLIMRWDAENTWSRLNVNLKDKLMSITYEQDGHENSLLF